MDDDIRVKSDVFEIRNIAKILLCAAFVGIALYQMISGFLFSEIVTAANQIRYKVVSTDIKLDYLRIESSGAILKLVGKAKNISDKAYWAVVFDVDLLDRDNRKLGRIRAGSENVLPGSDLHFEEILGSDNVCSARLFRIDGITKNNTNAYRITK